MNHRWYRLYLICLTFFSIFFSSLQPTFRSIARSVKVLNIKSIKQTLKNQNQVIFEGEVEVLIDDRIHIWADHVFFDKEQQILIAQSHDGSAISIEDGSFLILADRFEFNISQKTGSANNIRFHVDEGYFSAGKAEKLDESDWKLDDMYYTACDADDAHWHIRASHATVHANYLVKASGVVFKMGAVPIFALPRFVFPIQGRSKSGFLVPRFFWDYDYGFGIRQEYYKYLGPHSDNTFGIDWRAEKGIAFIDDFRWARAPENFTLLGGYYAIVRDRYVLRHKKIVKATDSRYWLGGKDFRKFPKLLGMGDLSTLMRVDYGTDKRFGYQFFSSTEEVDDTFNNSLYTRLLSPVDVISVNIEDTKVGRKRFSSLPDCELQSLLVAAGSEGKSCVVREVEDRVNLAALPHVEWNSTYKSLYNMIYYRHNLFFDQMLYRQEEIERVYFDSHLVRDKTPIPLSKVDLIRFFYRGDLTEAVSVAYNSLRFTVQPTFQAVSSLVQQCYASRNVFEGRAFNKGAYRLYFTYGAEWALPEVNATTPDYEHRFAFQPLVTWSCVPKFFQDNWYYLDKWDRAYPKNELALTVRNSLDLGTAHFQLDLTQGYDFYKNGDIFFLRRGVEQQHLLPFRYDAELGYHDVHCSLTQEFQWPHYDIVQSQASIGLLHRGFNLGLGYLYQKPKLQDERQLLSQIPHFMLINLAVPFGSNTTLSYEGQFYATRRKSIFSVDGITPLIHRVRLDYDGHCWGFYLGYEEKRYKEYGMRRNERAIIFAFRLNSLGSFAKKFKRMPQTFKD